MRSLSIFINADSADSRGRLHIFAGELVQQIFEDNGKLNVSFKYRLLMTARWKRYEGK